MCLNNQNLFKEMTNQFFKVDDVALLF